MNWLHQLPSAAVGRWGPAPRQVAVMLGAAVVLFAGFGLLTVLVVSGATTSLDAAGLQWFMGYRTTEVTTVALVVTDVGGTVGVSVIAGLGGVLFWRLGAGRAALAVLAVGAVGAGLLVSTAKDLIGRVRPSTSVQLMSESSAAFPSGHTLGSVVVFGLLALLAGFRLTPGRARVAVLTVGTTAILLVAATRLYLGVHWVTDVVGAILLGAAWLLTVLAAYSWHVQDTASRCEQGEPVDPARPAELSARAA